MLPETIRENRLKYVEALESRKYTQIREQYFAGTGTKYCCASGVAIDVLGYRDAGITKGEDRAMFDLGIDDNLNVAIITWNDGDRLTFREIAEKLRLLWEL